MELSTKPFSEQQFWNCISILLRNYHAVNKKIFACVLGDIRCISHGISAELNSHSESAAKQVKSSVCTPEQLEACLSNVAARDDAQCEGFTVKFKFLTKKLEHNISAVGVIDLVAGVYSCQFLNCDIFDDFSVKFCNENILVEIRSRRLDLEKSERWAEFVLKPKLQKWCFSVKTLSLGKQSSQSTQSLRWVDIEDYNDLYKKLKRKYAEQVLQFWSDAKESTDPLKFIYEDLAIAAYLIVLWRSPVAAPPPTAFADLGCGNGLLVYILNAEGYKGYGYDIRARKLWSFYPADIAQFLIEQAVEPDAFRLPADVTWLIGNHSDELSPWLPVLAANVNYFMRYFLLPCCAYELSGAKFQRRNSAASVYQDFYAYAAKLSNECGFRTLEDRLKIPSTKRLALLGIERTHEQAAYEAKRREIEKFVADERQRHTCSTATAEEANTNGSSGIKLRERIEKVRNCTKIDADIIEALVQQIFGLLLSTKDGSDKDEKLEANINDWHRGGELSMSDIAMRLSSDDLKRIKAECGGIKTLLRNKHEIFEFCGSDLIGIRKPQVRKAPSSTANNNHRPQTVKKRMCFFKQHHPQGCPLSAEQCTFIH